jgi:hypothetical protein
MWKIVIDVIYLGAQVSALTHGSILAILNINVPEKRSILWITDIPITQETRIV